MAGGNPIGGYSGDDPGSVLGDAYLWPNVRAIHLDLGADAVYAWVDDRLAGRPLDAGCYTD